MPPRRAWPGRPLREPSPVSGPCGSPATRPSRPTPRTSQVRRRDRAGSAACGSSQRFRSVVAPGAACGARRARRLDIPPSATIAHPRTRGVSDCYPGRGPVSLVMTATCARQEGGGCPRPAPRASRLGAAGHHDSPRWRGWRRVMAATMWTDEAGEQASGTTGADGPGRESTMERLTASARPPIRPRERPKSDPDLSIEAAMLSTNPRQGQARRRRCPPAPGGAR